MYVYRHIRLDKNEPFYVGVGTKDTNYASFKTEYRRAYDKRCARRNELWGRIASKTEYSVEILFDDLPPKEAGIKEQEFIKLYGRINNNSGTLANLSEGGEGNIGYAMSEETKNKIREKLRGNKNGAGQIPSDKERKRRSEWLKINKIALGCKHSDEHREKNRLAHIGKVWTEQQKLNISIVRKGMTGGLTMKPVIQLDGNGLIINEFKSITECSVFFKCSDDTISKIIRGVTKKTLLRLRGLNLKFK